MLSSLVEFHRFLLSSIQFEQQNFHWHECIHLDCLPFDRQLYHYEHFYMLDTVHNCLSTYLDKRIQFPLHRNDNHFLAINLLLLSFDMEY